MRQPPRPFRARLALERLEDRCLLSTGGLDNSFSADGKQVVAFDIGGNFVDEGLAVAFQTFSSIDQKIVVAGSAQTTATDRDFAVLRFNRDGSLDATFGTGGKVIIPFNLGGDQVDVATSIAVLPSNKIVVAGYAMKTTEDFDFAVARLNVDGSIDTQFGVNGKRTFGFDVGGTLDDRALGLAVQGDGKLVLAGYAQVTATDRDMAVIRLLADGSLDTTFDTDGKLTVAFNAGGQNQDEANAVVVQGDGRIVLAGSADRDATGNKDFAIVRLNASGSLDLGFNNSGKQVVSFDLGGQNEDVARAVALDTLGRIVLAGSAHVAVTTNKDFALARLNTNGTLDQSFNLTGKKTVSFDLGGDNEDVAYGLALQRDGKLVAVGSIHFGATTNRVFGAARLLPDGSADLTFNTSGKKFVDVDAQTDGEDGARAVAVQSDGNLVLVGATRPTATANRDVAVIRLIGDQWVVTAPDAGAPPVVKIFSPTGTLYRQFSAYGDSFTGGVRIALADITGDTVPDAFTAPGPGGQPFVNIFDGVTFQLIKQIQVYGITFTNGVNLAVSDVLGMGSPQLIVAPEAGGQPFVNLFNPATGAFLKQFLAYGITFTGGVRIATADVNNDTVADVLTAPGPSGSPFVNFFNASATPVALIRQIQVYGASFTGGIFLATGDVTGDGRSELLVGPDRGGQPFVNAFDTQSRELVRQYAAFGITFTAGVRIGAVDVNSDGMADIVVGAGPGGEPWLRILDGLTRQQLGLFLAYAQTSTSGLFALGVPR